MKILFLIRSMNYGGAERQLVVLSKGLWERGHDVAVAMFYGGGSMERELRGAGIRVLHLHKGGRWDILPFMRRLVRVVRNERPDVLHGYLSDPNLVASAAKLLFPSMKIVWGVRVAALDFAQYGWFERVGFWLTCRVSRFADAIIVNSYAGRRYHVALGYPADKTVVIPNGIDTERYRPDVHARRRLREQWGVLGEERLVGIVGRLDPIKDHSGFLKAARLLIQRRDDVRFVCIGEGPEEYRHRLMDLSKSLGLEKKVLWLGGQHDMPAVYNALDVHVSSSYGEGFSNVVCEAMACGVPCVVTDVGDSAWIVGAHGEVVPPRSPVALAHAVEKVIEERHRYNSAEIRTQIVDRLSVTELTIKSEDLITSLVRGAAKGGISDRLTNCHADAGR